jgi:hypothetical protein
MELDEQKTELALIYKANQKRKQWEIDANLWSMRWQDKTIRFNKGNTRWLGFHLDRCLNLHAHVDTCVQRALWKQQQVRRFMAAYGINRKLARTVAWSTAMATATYGIEVMYEGQQWIVDQIQKLNVKIAKDIAGLKSTTAGCDAIRSADTPPTRAMLDRRTERHFMRLLTQKNSNSDLIPDELDGMVDEEDIPTLDSWTERTAEDLWVLGDEVEQSLPVDLEFAPWHEEELIGEYGSHIDEYHGWTDGSRRVSAAFGWSLRGYNDQGNRSRTIYWTQLWSVKHELATGLSAQISRSSGQVMLLGCLFFCFCFFFFFMFIFILFVCSFVFLLLPLVSLSLFLVFSISM